MDYKRLGSMAALLMLLAFPASASMVSFLMVETGINEEVSSGQYTSLWEGGLMAAFFDAGHIVTNGPVARMEKKPSRDLTGTVEVDFNEAVKGGAEYFILGFIEYQVRSGKPVPVGIALKLYQTDSKKLVFEQSFPAGSGKNLDEEYLFAQNAGKVIISHLKDR
jgi:hypothetical protein